MAQTLTESYFHLIFSTKNRVKLIRPEIEEELYAYIGGILNNHSSKLLIGNGTETHSHLLLSLNKNLRFPDIVGDIKRSSSKWIKTKGGMLGKFEWQDCYSAFTVGHTQLSAVKNYIANQKEHTTLSCCSRMKCDTSLGNVRCSMMKNMFGVENGASLFRDDLRPNLGRRVSPDSISCVAFSDLRSLALNLAKNAIYL